MGRCADLLAGNVIRAVKTDAEPQIIFFAANLAIADLCDRDVCVIHPILLGVFECCSGPCSLGYCAGVVARLSPFLEDNSVGG